MNPIIEQRYADFEVSLISSSKVSGYRITRRDIGYAEGKFRVRIQMADDSHAEFFEYVTESNQQVQTRKYSFHWQDRDGTLRRRWDNAPHYPGLVNFPHHIHQEDGSVIPNDALRPDMFAVFAWIEQHVNL